MFAKSFFKPVATAAFLCALASSALAGPLFRIDPGAIGKGTSGFELFQPSGIFSANRVEGASSEVLVAGPGNTLSGSGYALLSNFLLGTTSTHVTGINGYKLYLDFDLDVQLSSGTFLEAGSSYNVTALNFTVRADLGNNTTFNDALLNGNADIGGVTSDDIVLGFGQLISGVANLNAGGGVGLNTLTTFAQCSGSDTARLGEQTITTGGLCAGPEGVNYFFDPYPFYQLAFTGFNNTGQGFEVVTIPGPGGRTELRVSASGSVDFREVPEPASLALVGMALLGAASVSARRRKG